MNTLILRKEKVLYDCKFGLHVRILTVEAGVPLTLWPALGTLFSHWVAFSNLNTRLSFVLPYCILFCCVCCFLEAFSFFEGKMGGVDLGER